MTILNINLMLIHLEILKNVKKYKMNKLAKKWTTDYNNKHGRNWSSFKALSHGMLWIQTVLWMNSFKKFRHSMAYKLNHKHKKR